MGQRMLRMARWAAPFMPWVLLTGFVGAGIWWLGPAQAPKQPADYAAWVQAIFSVAAIVAAVLLSNMQHRRERAAEVRRAQQERLERMTMLWHLLEHAYRLVKELPNKGEDADIAIAKVRSFDLLALDRAIAMLERLGPKDVPDGLTLSLLMHCIGDLQTIRAVTGIAIPTLEASRTKPTVWIPQQRGLDMARERVQALFEAALKNAVRFQRQHRLDP